LILLSFKNHPRISKLLYLQGQNNFNMDHSAMDMGSATATATTASAAASSTAAAMSMGGESSCKISVCAPSASMSFRIAVDKTYI